MNIIRRRIIGASVVALGLLAAAAVAAPYLRADFFGERIRRAIEQSLGRRVEIASVRFSLLGGPGFTLRQVVIEDDPAAGIEPFAYVDSLEARVGLKTLAGGKLEFASLRLVRPSVNLVKSSEGGWNFQQLLSRAAQSPLPRISVSEGRINFKLDGVKSAFYVRAADLDVRPPQVGRSEFTLEFRGEPARTDRTAKGFGEVRGRGRWRGGQSGGELTLDVDLEKSSLGELVALIRGADAGVHGQASGKVSLRGPLTGLQVNGTVVFSDIHRWDQLPPYAEGGTVHVTGELDLPKQQLSMDLQLAGQDGVRGTLKVVGLMEKPEWEMSVHLDEYPIQPLGEIARHMGAELPEELEVKGMLSGDAVYSPRNGLKGAVTLRGLQLGTAGGPRTMVREARLVIEGNRLRLGPAVAEFSEGETARIELEYQTGTPCRIDFRVASEGISGQSLARGGGILPGIPPPPVLTELSGGVWNGWLRFRKLDEEPGSWSGSGRIRDALVSVAGMAFPVEIGEAEVEMEGERVHARKITGKSGPLSFRAEYWRQPDASRPHRVALQIEELKAPEVETTLAPCLKRPQGLLARALNLGRGRLPAWLAGRKAEGKIQIGDLSVAGEDFKQVRLSFFWDGGEIDIPQLEAKVRGGTVSGFLRIDLRGALPAYLFSAKVEDAVWREGLLNGDGTLRTSGLGEELYWNLRAEGFFRAHSVVLGPGQPRRSLWGQWALRWDRRQPRLEVSEVRLNDGQDVLVGQGTTLENDQLRIDTAHGDRRLRLAGSLRTLEFTSEVP